MCALHAVAIEQVLQLWPCQCGAARGHSHRWEVEEEMFDDDSEDHSEDDDGDDDDEKDE